MRNTKTHVPTYRETHSDPYVEEIRKDLVKALEELRFCEQMMGKNKVTRPGTYAAKVRGILELNKRLVAKNSSLRAQLRNFRNTLNSEVAPERLAMLMLENSELKYQLAAERAKSASLNRMITEFVGLPSGRVS